MIKMKDINVPKDYELMNEIIKAQRSNQDFVEFKYKGSNVRIRIKKVYNEGIMRGNIGYYSK